MNKERIKRFLKRIGFEQEKGSNEWIYRKESKHYHNGKKYVKFKFYFGRNMNRTTFSTLMYEPFSNESFFLDEMKMSDLINILNKSDELKHKIRETQLELLLN